MAEMGGRSGWRTRAGSLLAVGLWIGLAESLGVFFWGHVRGGQSWIWLRELLLAGSLGTLLGAALVVGLGAGLAGAGWLSTRALPRSAKRARAATARIGSLPVLMVCWALLRLVFSGNSADLRAWSMQIGGVLLLVLIVAGLPRALGRLTRFWPLGWAPLLCAVVWLALGAVGRGRFTEAEMFEVTLCSGLPVVLLAVGWVLGRGSARRRWAALAGAILLSAGFLAPWAPGSVPPAGADRPNVLLVTIDTLRTDRADGSEAVMPRLAALAAAGARYERAYTPIPKTQQSLASIHTGLLPWHHGVRELFTPLPPGFDTLAEKFARAGYRTAAFVHNVWIDYGMGHEQGFGEYHDHPRVESLCGPLQALLSVRLLDHTLGRKRGASEFQVDGRVLANRVVDWLGDSPRQPWFVWVHLFDPHWPYLPPAGTPGRDERDVELARDINQVDDRRIDRGRMIFHARQAGLGEEQIEAARRLYSAEVAYTDVHLGRILDALRADRPNLVVVTADHGESLGEHDYHFHHGDFTYEACLRVPLIVSWPGRIPAGRVIAQPVMTIDLVETLCRLSGIEPGETDGRMLPGLDDPSFASPSRIVAFEGEVNSFSANDRIFLDGLAGKWRGVIRFGWKLIAIPHPKGTRFELYDLDSDPQELVNLHASTPAALGELQQALLAAGLEPTSSVGTAPAGRSLQDLSDEELERLRSLGYVE